MDYKRGKERASEFDIISPRGSASPLNQNQLSSSAPRSSHTKHQSPDNPRSAKRRFLARLWPSKRRKDDISTTITQLEETEEKTQKDILRLRESYQFLIPGYLDLETLNKAIALSQKWGVPVHQVLISLGWLLPEDYSAALARRHGVKFIDKDEAHLLHLPGAKFDELKSLEPKIVAHLADKNLGSSLDPTTMTPDLLKNVLTSLAKAKQHIALTSPSAIRHMILRLGQQKLCRRAIMDLQNRFPNQSASSGITLTQLLSFACIIGLIIGSSLIDPQIPSYIIAALLTFFFFGIVVLRLVACILFVIPWRRNRKRKKHIAQNPIPDSELPIYTLLVPAFHEANILPQLIDALGQIDYPTAKLDIKLILESDDEEMISAIKNKPAPAHFDVIIVPKQGPQTKPKALNYALHFARGEFVVIYDAEDLPQVDQLRKAVAYFRAEGEELACLQAQLNYYNAYENWLTRQFTIEYSAFFAGLLPAFERLNLPIPLGGTSNHFRIDILKKICAWDAFNVTEDADLGMRLYRHGYNCKILPSTTFEEANCKIRNWTKQRTRWLKGWMQTYLVHMRNPLTLLRDLGFWRFIGFQAIIGGFIVSALAHPIFYILLINDLYHHGPSNISALWTNWPLWELALFNLGIGYLAAMLLGFFSLLKLGFWRILTSVLGMPLYWFLISFAAYRAIYQLITDPFYWEKTPHGLTKMKAEGSPILATLNAKARKI